MAALWRRVALAGLCAAVVLAMLVQSYVWHRLNDPPTVHVRREAPITGMVDVPAQTPTSAGQPPAHSPPSLSK